LRPKRKYQRGVSQLGYRDDSPYRSSPSLMIHSPLGLIDMSHTGIPLMAQDETGFSKVLPPYSGMHRFPGSAVREYRMEEGGAAWPMLPYKTLIPPSNTVKIGDRTIDRTAISNIVQAARKNQVDPYTALAIAYQESGIDKDHPYHLNPDVYGTNYGNADQGMRSIVAQMQYADRLQKSGKVPSGEDYRLQGYNGYGIIKRGHADLEGANSIYGQAIPDNGIDLRSNPLYGKRIIDIRENLLRNNPYIQEALSRQRMGGETTPQYLSTYPEQYSFPFNPITQRPMKRMRGYQRGGKTFDPQLGNYMSGLSYQAGGLTPVGYPYQGYNDAERGMFSGLMMQAGGVATTPYNWAGDAGAVYNNRFTDFINNYLGAGTPSYTSTDAGRAFARSNAGYLSQPANRDVVSAVSIFNQRPDMAGLSPEQRVRAFYQLAGNNPNVEAYRSHNKAMLDQNGYTLNPLDQSNSQGAQSIASGYAKGGHWIQKAINPAHKGWCTPMTKSTCTGRRRALALLFKRKHGFHKKQEGGMLQQGLVMQEGGYPANYIPPNPLYRFSALTGTSPSSSDSSLYRANFGNMRSQDPFTLDFYKKMLHYGARADSPEEFAQYSNTLAAYQDALNPGTLQLRLPPDTQRPRKQIGGSFVPAGSLVNPMVWASDPSQMAAQTDYRKSEAPSFSITTHRPSPWIEPLMFANAGLASLASANEHRQQQQYVNQNLFNPLSTLPWDNGRSQDAMYGYNPYQMGGAAQTLRPYMLHQGSFQQGGTSPEPTGPITFMNAYFQSPEFEKRFRTSGHWYNGYNATDYKGVMDYFKEGRDRYKPFVLGPNDPRINNPGYGSAAGHSGMDYYKDLPKGTTVLLNPKSGNIIRDPSTTINEDLPHEYAHTIRAFTPDEIKRIGELSNGSGSKGIDLGIPHDDRPNEQYSQLSTLRWLLKRNGYYDVRKGDLNLDILNKALQNKEINSSQDVQTLLKHFSPENLIKFNNEIAYGNPVDNNYHARYGGKLSTFRNRAQYGGSLMDQWDTEDTQDQSEMPPAVPSEPFYTREDQASYAAYNDDLSTDQEYDMALQQALYAQGIPEALYSPRRYNTFDE